MDAINGAIRSKTIWFSVTLAVLSAAYAGLDNLAPFLSKQTIGLIGLVISICIAALRVVTTMPLSAKVSTSSTTNNKN